MNTTPCKLTVYGIELLKSASCFADLESTVLAGLARSLRPRSCLAGATVFSEGDACRDLYVLASGRVKFSRISVDGREQVLRIFDGPGDTFCLASAFSTGMHIVTGTAVSDTELLLLDARLVHDLARHHPSLGMKLVAAAGEHLRHLVDLADDLALKSATERLAKHLHQAALARSFQGRELRLPRDEFREEDLAALLGTVRVNVSRTLAKLVRDDAIALERDAIVVRNMTALQRIAGGT